MGKFGLKLQSLNMAKKFAAGNILAYFGNRTLLRTSIIFSLVLSTLFLSPLENKAHAADMTRPTPDVKARKVALPALERSPLVAVVVAVAP